MNTNISNINTIEILEEQQVEDLKDFISPETLEMVNRYCDKWTPDHRLQACLYYMILGSSYKVAGMTGIPPNTVRNWMQTPWWKELTKEVRKAQQDKLDIRMTEIIHAATEGIMDRINNGDYRISPKGDVIRVPMSSRDLSVAGVAVMYDKRALLRGDPTSRVERVSTDDLLNKLKETFEDLASKTSSVSSSQESGEIIDGEFEELFDPDGGMVEER